MKRIYYVLAFLSTFGLHLLLSTQLSAQVKDASIFLQSWKTLLKSISENVVDIALLLVGLAGMVMAIPNAIKHFKGDPTSSDAFLKLGGGLVLGVIIIQLCRILIA